MYSVVDQLKTAYDLIDITCIENSVRVRVEVGDSSWRLRYSHTPNGCQVVKFSRNDQFEKIVGRDYMEIVLYELGTILRPAKIRMEKLEIRAHGPNDLQPIVDLFVSISKTANSKFHVKSAEIEIQESNLALSVLSVMKPGVLENLEIGSYEQEPELIDLNQIKDMEQFKQAKTVNLTPFGIIQSMDLPIFLGFEKFDVCVKSMEPEDVIRLRDDLSKPDNTIFKRCSIELHTPLENIVGIARALGKGVTNEERIRYLEHSCSIANSVKVLKFLISEDEIGIQKTDPTPDHIYYYSDSDSDSDDSDSDDSGSDDSEFDSDDSDFNDSDSDHSDSDDI